MCISIKRHTFVVAVVFPFTIFNVKGSCYDSTHIFGSTSHLDSHSYIIKFLFILFILLVLLLSCLLLFLYFFLFSYFLFFGNSIKLLKFTCGFY